MQIGISRTTGRAALAVAVAVAALALGAGGASASEGTLTLAPQPHLVAKPAIVGGTPTAIAQLPWQVFVESDAGGGRAFDCGGSIYDPTHIVTAGHCVFNGATHAQFDASVIHVAAGISDTDPFDATRQIRGVVAVRVHPGYSYTPENAGVAPDDVAMLQLDRALDLSGATARAILLVPEGPGPAAGTPGTISGFGLQAAGGTPDGLLYSIGTAVGDPLACGSDSNALVLCISSPAGSACEGDSGGPLVIGGVLAGVASFVTTNGPTGECGVGSVNGYTNVAAPEIQEFIKGSDTPPAAPRGGRDVSAQGIFQAGKSMTCTPGTWSGAPAFSFAFIDTRNGQVLQAGASATYGFTDADVGRTVACQPTAANAGGTAITRTQATPAIAAAPPPPPVRVTPKPQPSLHLSVSAAHARVARGASLAYTIRVVNRGRVAAKRVVVCDAPGRGLSFRSLTRGAKKSHGRACWTVGTIKPGRGRTLKATLRVARGAKPGLVGNAVSVRSSNAAKRSASVRVRVRR